MVSATLIPVTTLLGMVLATISITITTPANFTPSSDTLLGVFYNTRIATIIPGSIQELANVATAPRLALSSGETYPTDKKTYVCLMVDPDVLINNQKTTLLHWIAQDLHVVKSGGPQLQDGFDLPLANASRNLAEYVSPQPPRGETHRYIFLLFEQPAGFSLPAGSDYNTAIPDSRFNFDLQDFISQTKLGSPLAGNYFFATNMTSTVNTAAGTTVAAGTTSECEVHATATTAGGNSTYVVGASATPTHSFVPANAGAVGEISYKLGGLLATVAVSFMYLF